MARREYQNPNVLTREGKKGPEYYIRYRVKVVRMVDGRAKLSRREKWHVLGLCSEMTERQAKRERDNIIREVNGQAYSIQSHIPFADFVALYRERRLPELRPTTRITYDQWLRIYIEPYFAGKKLCDIKPGDVHLFLSSLAVAPLTRRTIRGTLSAIFNLAIAWGYWQEQNPVKLAFISKTLPAVRKRPRRIWTMPDLQKILFSVRPDVQLIIKTLVWTGIRISECLGLKWKHVDLAGGWLRIEQRQCRGDVGEPKSVKSRRMQPLCKLTEEYARIKGDDEEYVFTRDGRLYRDCELLANYLSPILRSLNLKFDGAGWHTFRRMHLSWFSEAGASAFEVRDQAGHSNMDTTSIYVFADMERRAGFVRLMQDRFEELCGTNAGSEPPN